MEETAEADAYATSLQQASEISVNAARRPGLELVTSRLYPHAEANVMSNRDKAFVALRCRSRLYRELQMTALFGVVPSLETLEWLMILTWIR